MRKSEGMNPYYQNWSYGYTLQPSTEQSRGAYNVQYGGHQGAGGGGGGHHQGGQQAANNWAQIKGNRDCSPSVISLGVVP